VLVIPEAIACPAPRHAFAVQVRCVPLATLNPSRLELLIERYLQLAQQQQLQLQAQGQQYDLEPTQQQPQQPDNHAGGLGSGRRRHGLSSGPMLPTPSQLAAEDPVFHVPRVRVGTPLHKLVQQHGSQLGELGELLRQQQGHQMQQGQQQGQQQERQRPAQRHLLVPAGRNMHLLLHEQADSADCILGFVHAYLVQHCQSASGRNCSFSKHSDVAAASSSAHGQQQQQQPPQPQQHCEWQQGGGSGLWRMQESLAEARRLLPGLLAALEAAGWDDEKVVLEAKRRRVSW
jgi:hypothetical protein